MIDHVATGGTTSSASELLRVQLQGKAKVTLLGVGNIGSQVVPHLARSALVGAVTIVDFDRYEPHDMLGQDIRPADVGKPKAVVQARRLKHINPSLQVTPRVARLENVPWADLRADVMLAALDSRVARLHVSEVAVRLGVPWVDAAVDASGMLARVNVYRPQAAEAACLECGWDDGDYAAVEQVHPCLAGRAEGAGAAPTNAPTSLGAAAAAIQIIECEKVLAGQWERALVGRQVLIDLRHHKHYVTAIGRNPHCRFDHQVWEIRRLRRDPAAWTLEDALALGGRGKSSDALVAMGPAGDVFVRRLACTGCQRTRPVLRISRRLHFSQMRCRVCGEAMAATGFDAVQWLDAAAVSRGERRLPLHRLGFRGGDVFALRRGDRIRYYELQP